MSLKYDIFELVIRMRRHREGPKYINKSRDKVGTPGTGQICFVELTSFGQRSPDDFHGGFLADGAHVRARVAFGGPGGLLGVYSVGVGSVEAAAYQSQSGRQVRSGHQDSLVGPPQQRRIDVPGQIGGGHEEHVVRQTVQLHQQFCLEPAGRFVLASAASRGHQRVHLVEKYDRRSAQASRLEQGLKRR